MSTSRQVKLFRNGRNQAVRIPREFELPGDEAVMRQEGDRLIIELPVQQRTLVEILAEWAKEPPLRDDETLPRIPRQAPRPFDL
ncbi:antitoxin [Brevundimonas halotolerans]|uniref:Antitoxin VapB n=1 Tax=Brevundimonas halotolerans TaxID=69670 RepID=A0A7W9A4H8_9CAUL|nr:AbrB/MazE/SpoVT family DNA-binding domain-containing protein [Brevundimonas halotolerans]MBB5661050.1 antitoxin VapB [Brevundimonas halotolerans]